MTTKTTKPMRVKSQPLCPECHEQMPVWHSAFAKSCSTKCRKRRQRRLEKERAEEMASQPAIKKPRTTKNGKPKAKKQSLKRLKGGVTGLMRPR
jgi:hypothetical protein